MAGGKQQLTIGIRIDGARETLAAFRRLPREASEALRIRSGELATALAAKVAGAARSDSPQSALMVPTVKPRRDRIPVIEAGGSTRVGSRRTPAFNILFGSEFGSRQYRQFRPHLGRDSYWMFATVDENEAQIAAAWELVVEDIRREFGSGV